MKVFVVGSYEQWITFEKLLERWPMEVAVSSSEASHAVVELLGETCFQLVLVDATSHDCRAELDLVSELRSDGFDKFVVAITKQDVVDERLLAHCDGIWFYQDALEGKTPDFVTQMILRPAIAA